MVAPLRSIINQALTTGWNMPSGYDDLVYRGGPGPLEMQNLPAVYGAGYGGVEPLGAIDFGAWSRLGSMPSIQPRTSLSATLFGTKQQTTGGAQPAGSGRRLSDTLFGTRGATGGASGVAAAGSSPVTYDTSGAPLTPGVKASVIKWLPQVQKIAAEYGVPLEMALAVMSNESGGDPKATSAYNPGSGTAKGLYQTLDLHYQPGQDPYDPETNMRAGLKFMGDMYKKFGTPEKAMAAYFGGPGAIDAQGNIRRNIGDVNITVGRYLDERFTPALAAYRNYLQGATQTGTAPVAAAAAVKVGKATLTGLTPNQFNVGLSAADAMSACGPVAAVAFAKATGRTPTPQEAINLAKQVGWTQGGGMAGPQSQVTLLQRMGVNATLSQGVDWAKVATEVQAGRPVIIDTPQHYWVVEGFDPASGRFDFGNSARALKASGGRNWLTAQEMTRINAPRSSIYLGGG